MNRFAGTGTLTRLALRRDRVMVPAWVATFTLVTAFSAIASKDIYRNTAELRHATEGWNATTALVAIHGRIYDTSSLGAGSMVKMTGLGTAMVGLLAILLVIRHTRADEEVGRTELAAGGVVGQYAALTAALAVSALTVVALGVLSGLSLLLGNLPASGSLAFALAWSGAGLVFAGVGACAAQLATTARAARGLASAILAATYAVRALGDTQPADGARWLSWLSPFGWSQQVRPFAGDRWAALLPPLIAAPLLLAAAATLLAHRDLGSGLLTDRPGPARGTRLVSPLALTWRLERQALLAWTVGAAVLGAVLGSIASTIADLFDNARFSEYLRLLGGVSRLEDAFLSTELGLVALLVSAFGISSAQRMHSEEAQGRAEPLLATGVSRLSYAVAHLVVALAGTALMLAVAGLAIGASHAAATGDPAQVGRVLGAALVRLPAVWVMTALVMALFGVAGRLTPLAWVALVGVVVVGEFGPLMELPHWTLDLSPFAHVPSLPGSELTWTSSVWLTAVAAALAVGGLFAFRHRDLQSD